MTDTQLIKHIVAEIRRISQTLDLPHPSFLSKAQFLENSPQITEWHLRKLGGLGKLLNEYFPFTEKDLKFISLNRQRASYIKRLEKKYGDFEALKDQLNESLLESLKSLKVQPIVMNEKATKEYLARIARPSLHDKSPRSVVTVWSDQHYGTTVDSDELAGKNEFNWVVGARRLGMLVEQLETYKIELRNLHEELVILLLGDNIGGIIHNQEGPDYDLITYQINGTLSYYVQALNHLKAFYPKIRVYCQPGNHGRVQHKSSKDRATSQKYDSFENVIFYALSEKFVNDPKVEIYVPKAPYVDVMIQGHRIFGTHGDTLFETGNPGKAILTAKIENQINRINAVERDNDRKPFEVFAFGHVHQPAHFLAGSAHVAINGSLIGTDAYAMGGAGIMNNSPIQIVWECNKKYAYGDDRWVYVAEADKDARYEKIIKPYSHQLVAKKF